MVLKEIYTRFVCESFIHFQYPPNHRMRAGAKWFGAGSSEPNYLLKCFDLGVVAVWVCLGDVKIL